MAVVRLNTEQITDWASFHLVCKEAFGFFDGYGRNMDAWIDCMSCLTEDDGMTKFHLSDNEMLYYIEVMNTEQFNLRLPEILKELIECTAFVNNGYINHKELPKIALVFL